MKNQRGIIHFFLILPFFFCSCEMVKESPSDPISLIQDIEFTGDSAETGSDIFSLMEISSDRKVPKSMKSAGKSCITICFPIWM